MVCEGKKYRAEIGSISALIIRKADNASVWLQGDDVAALERDVRPLQDIEYPSGPFASYEEHLDAVLDAYDDVME